MVVKAKNMIVIKNIILEKHDLITEKLMIMNIMGCLN